MKTRMQPIGNVWNKFPRTVRDLAHSCGKEVRLDVVKTNVEKIGGTVDVQSVAGKGTTVRVKIPLTLAIIPALVVRCSGERFAIPQISLTELVRLESGKGIEMVHGAPVYRLRGQLLPLVFLSQTLNARQRREDGRKVEHLLLENEKKQRALQNVNIVVLQAEGRQFGLVVDDILDTEEIVVKPLGQQLKGISAYSGATIMGDGRIGSITGVISHINDISGTIATAVEEPSATTNEMTRNVADAAKGSGEITRNIEGVAEAARGTSNSAQESQQAANELAEMAVQLRGLVEQFKINATGDGRTTAAAPRADKSMAANAGK